MWQEHSATTVGVRLLCSLFFSSLAATVKGSWLAGRGLKAATERGKGRAGWQVQASSPPTPHSASFWLCHTWACKRCHMLEKRVCCP